LEKAWKAGIPHVIFTGGEPTLRDDLVELVAYAESLGQVSGLLTDGLRLVDNNYLNNLLQTGLDHLLIALQPNHPASWQALANTLAADIFTAVHLTLTPQNAAEMPATLKKLSQMSTPAISLSTQDSALNDMLKSLRDQAAVLQMTLIWDLPVPYSGQNPVAFEVPEAELVDGAGRAWLYVEPDGDVLPAQGVNRVLGNLLRDRWEAIWKQQ
jgi:MoaA/NifB/PqqE/SkfB family radical SAM enzyme